MNSSLPYSSVSVPSPDIAPALDQIFQGVYSSIPGTLAFMKNLISVLIGISLPMSVFLIVVIIYCVEQLKRIRKAEELKFDQKVVPAYEPVGKSDVAMAHRWQSVKKHMESDNPNDWRQAIIDADIILDDLLNKMGYRGESIGEKLKRVERGDFATLDDAWEAHKIRNQIAHGGATFPLNQHEAKAAVDRYKRVFEEFYYI